MEAPIETYIKDFVKARTGERVYIDLSTPSVVLIRVVSALGSSALSAFWLNILQHPNNYPVQHYPYRRLYHKNGTYKVVLTVDDVTLTVSMTLGSLKMKGEFVLYWFQTQFLRVLYSYEKHYTTSQVLDGKYSKLNQTWQRMPPLRRIEIVSRKEEEKTNEKIDKCNETQNEEDGNNEETKKVDEQNEQDIPVDTKKHLREAIKCANIASEEDVEKQIICLSAGCVQNGPDYIYILWKSLLNEWFKDSNNRVYIVTPRLDVDRLKDICDLVIKHRLTANLEAVYVHHKCDLIPNIGDIKRTVQQKYSSRDQVYIEYKIYSNIIYPLAEFQCNFIACVNQATVSVLQTSANFHGDHFNKESVDTISIHQMSKDEFHQRFLKPILVSQFLQVSEK